MTSERVLSKKLVSSVTYIVMCPKKLVLVGFRHYQPKLVLFKLPEYIVECFPVAFCQPLLKHDLPRQALSEECGRGEGGRRRRRFRGIDTSSSSLSGAHCPPPLPPQRPCHGHHHLTCPHNLGWDRLCTLAYYSSITKQLWQ